MPYPAFVETGAGIYDLVGGGPGHLVRFTDPAGTVQIAGTLSASTLNVTNIVTANAGLTVTGGAVNLNASSNFNTNINTGTSTGALTFGNSAAGAATFTTGNANPGQPFTVTTGNAVSGNNNGGDYVVNLGSGIGIARSGQLQVFETALSSIYPLLQIGGNSYGTFVGRNVSVGAGLRNPQQFGYQAAALYVDGYYGNPTTTVQAFNSRVDMSSMTADTANLIESGLFTVYSGTNAGFNFTVGGLTAIEADTYGQVNAGATNSKTVVNMTGVSTFPQVLTTSNAAYTTIYGFRTIPGTSGLGTVGTFVGVDTAITASSSGGANDALVTNAYGVRSTMNLNGTNATGTVFTQSINVYAGGNNFGALSTGVITTTYGMKVEAHFNTLNNTSTTGGYTSYGVYSTTGTQGGNTSGTNNNYGTFTAGTGGASGVAGTVNNYAHYVAVPNPTAAGTNNNYGIYLTGNGGSGGTTTNYAIFSASTAVSQIAGNFGIGSSSASNGLQVQPNNLTGASQIGIYVPTIFNASATNSGYSIQINTQTAASVTSSTIGSLIIAGPTYGAGSAITNAYGINISNMGSALVTTCYGIRIQAQSGSATNKALQIDGGSILFLPTAGNSGTMTIGNTTSTSAINIAANAASTWQVASANLTVSTTTSGTLLVSSAGLLTLTGVTTAITNKITSYNGVATAGWGIPAIQAEVQTGTTTNATATLATYAVPATNGVFHVSASVDVTVSLTVAMTVTVSYTDIAGTARVLTLPFLLLAGTWVTSITTAQGNISYESPVIEINAKASTSITVATAGTVANVVYTGSGTIEQVA